MIDGRRTFPAPVDQHEAVHLVGDADRRDCFEGAARPGAQLPGRRDDIVPPDRRVLLGPPGRFASMASSVRGADAEAAGSPVAASIRAALMKELPTSKPRR